MFTNANALDAARTIRSLLTHLVGNDQAVNLDQSIAQILNQEQLDENSKVDQLLDILNTIPETKAWIEQALNESIERSYQELVGQRAPTVSKKYICPYNDYIWFQEVPEKQRLCPTHLVPLNPV